MNIEGEEPNLGPLPFPCAAAPGTTMIPICVAPPATTTIPITIGTTTGFELFAVCVPNHAL